MQKAEENYITLKLEKNQAVALYKLMQKAHARGWRRSNHKTIEKAEELQREVKSQISFEDFDNYSPEDIEKKDKHEKFAGL